MTLCIYLATQIPNRVVTRGPQLFRITSTAIGIAWIHCRNQRIKSRFLNQTQDSYYYSCKLSIFLYITNHVRLNPLFGRQESLESHQESSQDSKRFQNHVDQNSELRIPRIVTNRTEHAIMVTWQLLIVTNCYGIMNLLLRKFSFTENQTFYEIFIQRKFGAIQ